MRAILVDDETIAIEVLSSMLSKYEEIEIVGKYTDPLKALEKIKAKNPDIIFLDIEMGNINGLEIAAQLQNSPSSQEIVFVTAYSEYAVEAFEINAIDYLLKPVQKSRLDRTINRLRGKIGERKTVAVTIPAKSVEDKKTNKLDIKSFGRFTVTFDAVPVKWRTKKTKELFAYLWLNSDKPVHKDKLIDEIFAEKEPDKAATLLHTTVYQLRKTLERLGQKAPIIYQEESYQLDIRAKSDLQELKQILKEQAYSDQSVESIIQMQTGSLMETESYQWAQSEQYMYHELILIYLLAYATEKVQKQERSPLLLKTLMLIHQMDPYNEDIAQLIVAHLGDLGHLSKMETFYHDFTHRLKEELNIRPTTKLVEIYERYFIK